MSGYYPDNSLSCQMAKKIINFNDANQTFPIYLVFSLVIMIAYGTRSQL